MRKLILPKRILLIAIFLGWSFDLFFYGKALGISLLLFVLLGLCALFYLGRSKSIHPQRRNLWLLLPLLFSAAMVAIRANPFLIFLNVAATLLLLEFVVHFFTSGRVEQLGIVEYPVILTWVAAQSSVQAGPLVPAAVDLLTIRQRTGRNLMPVVRGVLLALPILLVFTLILSSADQVFAAYVGTVFNVKIIDLLLEYAWRGILIMVISWFIAGGLAYSLLHQSAGRGSQAVQQMMSFLQRGPNLGFTESAVILALVNGLFATFVWVQFAYLFGGRTNIRVDGFTYAEYARRGFFELVFVSVMTLLLLLGLHWFTARIGRRQTLLFNGLNSLMSGLVMVMLVSAFQRLQLYEMAYGYTWLRLWVHIFMIWLGFVFVWFFLTLWPVRNATRETTTETGPAENIVVHIGIPKYFAFGIFLAGLGFLTTLNLINPDQFIARHNLARLETTGDLDVYYLTHLSNDSLPVIVPALSMIPGNERPYLCGKLMERREELNGVESWVSFNLGRYRARQILNNTQWQEQCPVIIGPRQ